MELFNISGSKAIITGASRGLGKGIAEAFMEAGAEVVCWATKPLTPDSLARYREKGYAVHSVGADLSEAHARESVFADALDMLGGRLDIFVNAAGVQRRHKSEVFPLKDWEEVIEVNLTAVFTLCQLAANSMLKQGYGKIINVASLLSYFGGYTVPAYAASKGGVAQLTKAFANEWASRGINVNAIAPGYMDTDMNSALISDMTRHQEILARIPAKRWGNADDMKGVAIFLASPASDYVHGAVIPVDGGYLGR